MQFEEMQEISIKKEKKPSLKEVLNKKDFDPFELDMLMNDY
jgi:hypothetical protein